MRNKRWNHNTSAWRVRRLACEGASCGAEAPAAALAVQALDAHAVYAADLRHPIEVPAAERAADWRLPWPDYTPTRYEQKAIRDGRTPCYLTSLRSG